VRRVKVSGLRANLALGCAVPLWEDEEVFGDGLPRLNLKSDPLEYLILDLSPTLDLRSERAGDGLSSSHYPTDSSVNDPTPQPQPLAKTG
jgi:hypothetical protein